MLSYGALREAPAAGRSRTAPYSGWREPLTGFATASISGERESLDLLVDIESYSFFPSIDRLVTLGGGYDDGLPRL